LIYQRCIVNEFPGNIRGDRPLNINEHIGILIRNVDMTISLYVKKQLEPFNLAPEQNLIMMMLWRKDGISPNEFTNKLEKDKANIARMIASLEKKGYVKRVADPSDKRTFKVHLTDEGKQLEDVVIPILEKSHQTILDGITAEQYVELQTIFTKIINNTIEGHK
jgi:MarR family transcriptional regulator, organic hydroperoxide resistance regulator